MAERAGVHAAHDQQRQPRRVGAIEAEVRRDGVDLLLISPERLNNLRFRDEVLRRPGPRRSGCSWSTRRTASATGATTSAPTTAGSAACSQLLPRGVPLLCTTATANDRVVADIRAQLGDDLDIIRGPLDRESLALSSLDLPEQARAPRVAGDGRCRSSPARASSTASPSPTPTGSPSWLRTRGIDARAYSGAERSRRAPRARDALLANSMKVWWRPPRWAWASTSPTSRS